MACCLCFSACDNSDKHSDFSDEDAYTGVPLVILDTDIGSSTDDLFAMELLYRYMDEGRCRFLGVVVDREGEENAALADVMNTYFGYPDMPIGLVRQGIDKPKVWIDYSALPSYTDENGELMFSRTLSDYSSLPDGWQLYRQLLASQPDHSVSICSIGFVTSLSQLLESEPDDYSPLNGVELVREKVKHLYVMGGEFDEAEEPDFNFRQGITFSTTFFNLWPADVAISFSPQEVGETVDYKPEQVVEDISWTDSHPIKQVYMRCDCNTGQRMWDPLAVINAVEGDGLFSYSPWGTVTFHSDGATTFVASTTGVHRYQLAGSPQWSNDMLQKIRTYNKISSVEK